ncbi:hypothetical protein J6590_064264 [Homalodisca vitripennis]|nr:hypothetical protein J6590_064264 [Homalodisca vitripennis]
MCPKCNRIDEMVLPVMAGHPLLCLNREHDIYWLGAPRKLYQISAHNLYKFSNYVRSFRLPFSYDPGNSDVRCKVDQQQLLNQASTADVGNDDRLLEFLYLVITVQ